MPVPDTIPTLKEVALYAIAFAQKHEGIQALPVVGVAHFINHDGPILQPGDLIVVHQVLRELCAEGVVSAAETAQGTVFIRHPDAPFGRSAVVASRPPLPG